MSSLLVFPGQGAQQPGMLQRLPPNPLVQACLQEAAQVLGTNQKAVCRMIDAGLLAGYKTGEGKNCKWRLADFTQVYRLRERLVRGAVERARRARGN